MKKGKYMVRKIVLPGFMATIVLLVMNSCAVMDQFGGDGLETSRSGPETLDEAEPAPDEGDEEKPGHVTGSDDTDGSREAGYSDQIIVTTPSPGQLIDSPLVIEGEARGTWFFEANFPVRLVDAQGDVIAEHYAETAEEWMTEDFISFTSRIEFERPDTATGILILIKNNPSDLREYDAQVEIPVRFE